MGLAPGLRFRVAPLFHCRADWPERLRLNGGLVQCDGIVLPRDDWRRCNEAELNLLVQREAAPLGSGATIDLLTLPAHMRRWWWEQAEADEAAPGTPGYAGFVGDLRDFLRFKRLPVPDDCAADVVATRPGQRSIRLDSAGRVGGFGAGALTASTGERADPLVVLNLGDERTHVVLLNRIGANGVAEFVARESAYPLVRVYLDAGEGVWFPSPAPAFDGCTVDKADLDVILVLSG